MSGDRPVNTAEREFEVLAKRFYETKDLDQFEFPADFVCAISCTLMKDPVMTVCGSVYERREIERWLFDLGKNTNPEDNVVLKNKTLTPCLPVKRRIEAFKQAVLNLGPEAAAKLAEVTADEVREECRQTPASVVNEASNSSSASPSSLGSTQGIKGKPISSKKGDHSPKITKEAAKVTFVCLDRIATRSDARKALLKDKTSAHIVAVLGTYLAQKRNNIFNGNRSVSYEYRNSSPDIAAYNHLMHKLERLSSDMMSVQQSKFVPQATWVECLKPFRRELFVELCTHNDIVATFAHSIAGGPMQNPELSPNILFGRNYLNSGKRSLKQFARLFSRYQVPRLDVGLELLQQVHTVFLIDDSGSMHSPGHTSWAYGYGRGYGNSFGGDYVNMPRNQTRWQQVRSMLEGIATIITEQDPQGIDIYFLNHPTIYTHVRSAQQVHHIFDKVFPSGGTLTGLRLNDILDGYMSTLRFDPMLKPLNVLVFTDGEANDESNLHCAIEEHVTRIIQRGYIAHQLGIEFIQVGDDRQATEHLWRLEEEVSRHHMNFQRDIVGVTPTTNISNMNSEMAIQILLSGIDARMNGYLRQRKVNV